MAGVREVDLQGAHVIPGLIDSHLHLIPGGISLSRLNLAAAASKRQLIGAVAEAVAQLPRGKWLLGGGWDEGRWGGEMPSREWLDEGECSGGWMLPNVHAGRVGSLGGAGCSRSVGGEWACSCRLSTQIVARKARAAELPGPPRPCPPARPPGRLPPCPPA